jgi:formylglycine-generating enzyme required for sulfatase activity
MKACFFLIVGLLLLAACAPRKTPIAPTLRTLQTAIPAVTATLAAPAPATGIPSPTKEIETQKKSAMDDMAQYHIPPGKFQMGTSADGDWIGEDEFPLHEILLSGYWMDETEVTNGQYQKCIQAGGCTPPHARGSETQENYFEDSDFADYPVIQVDWEQARAYCEWAGRRLPSEAEWEKAARGESERLFPWAGDAKGPHFANFDIDDNWPNADTTRVGSIPAGASPYKILDMAGNVYEWTADWYGADFYQQSPAENPTGPEHGTERVIRGGAWSSDWLFLRTASRLSYYPDGHSNDIGFRCAQSE